MPTSATSRRWQAFLVFGAGLVALSACAPQPSVISDIANHRAEAVAIRSLVAQGIMTAPRGRFQPDAPLTRVEFAQSMQRMFALKAPPVARNFPDVPSMSPMHTSVEALTPYLGREILCPGCALSSNFIPEARVSPLEAAVVTLNILLSQKKIELLNSEQSEVVVRNIPDSAGLRGRLLQSYAATAINSGILSRSIIEPANRVPVLTRARAAAMLDQVQTKFAVTKVRPGR